MFRIGDVAQLTGLTPRAIRYYEELGLLRPALHVDGANRRFAQTDLDRLQLIKRLREDVGLSLAEIRTYLDVEDLRDVLRTDYAAAVGSEAHLDVLDRAEPIIRRRLELLDHKLGLVAALRGEDVARLARIAELRQGLAAPLAGAADVR